jgi:hypothetical protein
VTCDLHDKLLIAISSRALFDLEGENAIFEIQDKFPMKSSPLSVQPWSQPEVFLPMRVYLVHLKGGCAC